MDATFVQTGGTIDHTPGSDVAAGAVVVQEQLVGVAVRDIAANTLGALTVEGIFDFPKASGDGGISVGEKVYWDPDADLVSTNDASGDHIYVGKCVKTAATGDTTCRARLDQ